MYFSPSKTAATTRDRGSAVPSQDDRSEYNPSTNAAEAAPATSNAALASRFNQMFPVLSPAETDRVRRFGEVRRFPAGDLLFQAGEAVAGTYVILSGRVGIVPRDVLGKPVPVAAFAQLIGAPIEEMSEVVPGEVVGEIAQLSGRPDLSAIDARAIDDVEAIFVPPEALRALLVAEAELGERILRALMLRRVALIEIGFGGPVIVGGLKSPDVTRLSGFLERNGIPFRVVDPDHDPDGSALLTRFAPTPVKLPLVVLSDRTVLENPTKHELGRAVGLVATSFREEPYDVAVVGAGPAGLATAVYGASEGLSIVVLEAVAFGGQAGASARIENYLGFPTGVSGQALMARAFTQAQKFGAEFSLSTEVKRVDCTSERMGPDPVHILELADGRRIRARAVVVATGARYRRPEIPDLGRFEGRGVSYWASPVEARLCHNEEVALVGEEIRPARPLSSSPATRATCGCWSAAPAWRAPCRATSSIGSRPRPTSRCSATPRSWSSSVPRTTASAPCGGATGAPVWRSRSPSDTCFSSPAPIRRRAVSPGAASPSIRTALSEPVPTWVRPSGCRCRWRPVSRGFSRSGTSVAARSNGWGRPSGKEPRSSRSCTPSSPGVD